jgi:hypothetical protein
LVRGIVTSTAIGRVGGRVGAASTEEIIEESCLGVSRGKKSSKNEEMG